MRAALAFSLLILAVLAFATLTGANSRSTPLCTAGTSSVDSEGHTTTHWYPEGCKH